MKFNLNVLMDDIKKAVLSIAKSIPRNELVDTLNKEVERLGQSLAKSPEMFGTWQLQKLINTAVNGFLNTHWEDIHSRVREAVVSTMTTVLTEDALLDKEQGRLRKIFNQIAESILKDKIKKYTLWKAEEEDEYVRKVVRSELSRVLKAADTKE